MTILGHVGIVVRDLRRSESFYSELFGIRTVWIKDGEKAFMSSGSGDILGLQVGEPCTTCSVDRMGDYFDGAGNTKPFTHFGYNYIDEDSFNVAIDRARALQIEVSPMHTSRDGTVGCYVIDPDGYVVQLTLVRGDYVRALSITGGE